MRALAVLAAVMMAGCWTTPPPPADGPAPGVTVVYFHDPSGDSDESHDLEAVRLFNLNGSFVLEMQFANVSFGGRFPLYNASIEVDRNDGGRVSLWASQVPNSSRGAPSLEPQSGRMSPSPIVNWEPCTTARLGQPATIRHEIISEMAGFENGGVVVSISVRVEDGEGVQKDSGQGAGSFGITPGRNAYPTGTGNATLAPCPLFQDPSSPAFRG